MRIFNPFKVVLILLSLNLTSNVFGSDPTVLLESGRQPIVKEFDQSPPVDKIMISPVNGTIVATANDREVAISLDPRTYNQLQELLLIPVGPSYNKLFSGDGSLLLMYSYAEGNKSGTQIVHTKNQKKEFWENRYVAAVIPGSSLALTQDSSDQDMVLRDLRTMKEIGRISEPKDLRSLVVSADKSSVAAYTEDKILFYDLKTLKEIGSYNLLGILPSTVNVSQNKIISYSRLGDSVDGIYFKSWNDSNPECRIELPSGSPQNWKQSQGSILGDFYMYSYAISSPSEGYNFIVWDTRTCSKIREAFIKMPLIYFEFGGFRFEYATDNGVWLSQASTSTDLVYWNWKTSEFEFFKVPAGGSFIDQRFSKSTKEYIGLSSHTIFGRPAEIVRIPLPH